MNHYTKCIDASLVPGDSSLFKRNPWCHKWSRLKGEWV